MLLLFCCSSYKECSVWKDKTSTAAEWTVVHFQQVQSSGEHNVTPDSKQSLLVK